MVVRGTCPEGEIGGAGGKEEGGRWAEEGAGRGVTETEEGFGGCGGGEGVETGAGAGEVDEVFDVVEMGGKEEEEFGRDAEEGAGLGRGAVRRGHIDILYSTRIEWTISLFGLYNALSGY